MLNPGAARCAACGKRQSVDPMVILLLAMLALAAFVAWFILAG